jgi:coenzyme F420-reducing hydrogenase delta subunit
MLEEIGVGGARLKMVNLSAAMAPTFVESVQEIVKTVKALGPSPLKETKQLESAGKI